MSDPVTISSTGWTARIEPRGAQLRSLTRGGVELLWPGDPDGWADSAPLLFPVVGRLGCDALHRDGVAHPHPMHGLARRRDFQPVEVACDRVRFGLDGTPEASFPWAWRLGVEFRLDGDGLAVEVEVTNPSALEALPFQVGWHPGFAGRDFRVAWDLAQDLRVLEVVPGEGRRTGEVRAVGDNLTEFVWSVQPTAWVSTLGTTRIRLEGGALPVFLEADPPPEAWVFWQRPGQDFLCPEPWYGLPDRVGERCEFAAREGTRTLAPGGSWQCRFRIGAA
jgi:galactose mutarotase-like enzyme